MAATTGGALRGGEPPTPVGIICLWSGMTAGKGRRPARVPGDDKGRFHGIEKDCLLYMAFVAAARRWILHML